MTDSNTEVDSTNYDNYCLYLRTVQSSAFRVLIEALKEILTDANLELDESGMGCSLGLSLPDSGGWVMTQA